MKDGIIKDDGTSRLVRSVADFKEKYPTYDDFAAALVAGTLPLDVLFNADGWSQQPDFLNKANLLKDATAALFKLSGDTALPDKVFEILSKAALVGEDGGLVIPSGGKVEGSGVKVITYTGIGKSGEANKITLQTGLKPSAVIIFAMKFPGSGSAATFCIATKDFSTAMLAYANSIGSLEYQTVTFSSAMNFEWGEDSVSYWAAAADKHFNVNGYPYGVIVFG